MLSALATRGVCAAVVMTAQIPKTKARKIDTNLVFVACVKT